MAASDDTKPTVVWVPGLLHTPEHFQPVISALAEVSIPSLAFSLPSVGAGAPTHAPYDDLKQLRAMLEGLVDEGKEVLLISHSYGGVPACQAIRGLQRSEREKTGQPGGIIRIVFMGAFVLKEGESTWTFTNGHQPPPWARREGNIWIPNIPECISEFFGDIPEESQKAWAALLQQASHNICTTPVARACWDLDVPKTYIITTEDVALPVEQQEAMIESVRDGTWSVKHIASSHSPFLSRIKELVGILESLL